jgi:hypothetical protein
VGDVAVGLGADVDDGADGLGAGVVHGGDALADRAEGEAVAVGAVGAVLPGAATLGLGAARPAGMAQPATSEAISAMAKLRTSNRCRGRANSQRRER